MTFCFWPGSLGKWRVLITEGVKLRLEITLGVSEIEMTHLVLGQDGRISKDWRSKIYYYS